MSFLFCTKAVASLARRTLFPAVLASMMVLGSQAASQAATVVFVEDLTTNVAASGDTIVSINIKGYNEVGTADFTTFGYQATLGWSTSDASVTDLITVNSSGSPALDASMTVSGTGYLFNGFGTDTPLMSNETSSSRFLTVSSSSPSLVPTMTGTQASPITLATIRFAVAEGVTGTFNLSFTGGQLYDSVATPVASSFQAGTLQVVPEPSTMASLFFVGLAATGFQVRRLRRKVA